MSYNTAKKAIDFLWEHSVDSKRVNIGFYGGEPLLEFELIKKITRYAEFRFAGKELSFNITTNGSLINDENIQYFLDHDISITISLDGPKEINDKNRVFADGTGTFDIVVQKLKMLQKKYKEYSKRIQISMVIDPLNDFDCINSITVNCDDIDFTGLNATIVNDTDKDVEFSEAYIIKSEYNLFLAYLSYLNLLPEHYISPIASNSMSRIKQDIDLFTPTPGIPSKIAPSGPCIPGKIRLFVDTDGKLYPCERVPEVEALCIGSLSYGFDIEKCKDILNIGKLTPNECRNCWAFKNCSLCVKQTFDGTILSGEEKLKKCKISRYTAFRKLINFVTFFEIPEYYKDLI